jgi:charged multivesicular body protein 4A/B
MSGWGLGWFGGGNAKQKDAPKKAILQLRGQLEMLNKREKHLQNQMDEQDAIARKNVATNKPGMIPTTPRPHQLGADISY